VAAFYADEDFPLQSVEALRRLGHDVLRASEAGLANRAVPDEEVLQQATERHRAVLTLNRWHFVALHGRLPEHEGIVVCSPDIDCESQARRIDSATREHSSLRGVLVRVNREPR
jgi:hypothetical protein